MSDYDNFGTVLMNIDKLIQENPGLAYLFDSEGKEMADKIFGVGLAPFLDGPSAEKAEQINVAVRLLAEKYKETL